MFTYVQRVQSLGNARSSVENRSYNKKGKQQLEQEEEQRKPAKAARWLLHLSTSHAPHYRLQHMQTQFQGLENNSPSGQ